MKIYLAGPLFSECERAWLVDIKRQLEEISQDITVIWPYDLIPHNEANSQGKQKIFEICRLYLDEVDALVCVLDGPQVDDGTAWEIGYFYCKHSNKLPIIGIRTDFRNAGETENSVVNAMIECSCSRIANSSEELIEILQQQVH
jgi:nucleoside 2-deoxyribosyltransferase